MNLKTITLALIFIITTFIAYPQFVSDSLFQTSDSLFWDSLINTYEISEIQDSLPKDTLKQSTASKIIRGPASFTKGAPDISEVFSFKKIFWAIIFILIGHFVIKAITKSLEIWSEKSAKRRVTLRGIIPFVKIFGWLLIIYVVVEGIFSPPRETLFAFFASIGVAIGFASQDILKNIFGGIMILLDRPFNVGDKIEAGSTYGEVTEIGLRSTRIVTADDSIVSFPNGELMNQSVSNSNAGENNCLVVAEIYLPITIDTNRVRNIATEAARVSKFIYLNKPISVLFFNIIKDHKSYFKMRLKAYVMDIRYEFAFKSDLTEIVIRELLKEGIISSGDFR